MKRYRRKIDRVDALFTIIMTIFVIVIVFPFYNAMLTSIVSFNTYMHSPVQLFPKEFILDNYKFFFTHSRVLTGYMSSIIITASGVFYGMFISLTMAYGLSRKQFPGKRLIFILMMVTMYFSGGLIPTYLLMKNLGFVNSRLGIILLCGVTPFYIIILKSSMEDLPASLEEAAQIDGANSIVIFYRIILPLMKPMIATFSLFIGVSYWNEWFWSMLLLNKQEKFTLQLVLRSIVEDIGSDTDMTTGSLAKTVSSEGIKMAAVMAAMLPMIMVYPFLQKYFAKGILIGAIKM